MLSVNLLTLDLLPLFLFVGELFHGNDCLGGFKFIAVQASVFIFNLTRLIVIGVAAPPFLSWSEFFLEGVVGSHAERVQIAKVELLPFQISYPEGRAAKGRIRKQPPVWLDVEHGPVMVAGTALTPQSPIRWVAEYSLIKPSVMYSRM